MLCHNALAFRFPCWFSAISDYTPDSLHCESLVMIKCFSGSSQNISKSANFESKRALLDNKRPGALTNQQVLLSLAFISKACIHISDIFYKYPMSSVSRNSSRKGGSARTSGKGTFNQCVILFYCPPRKKNNIDTQNYGLEKVTPALNIACFSVCYISGVNRFFGYIFHRRNTTEPVFFSSFVSQLRATLARFSHASWSRRSHVACA